MPNPPFQKSRTQMILHLIQRTIVWENVEKPLHYLLCRCHLLTCESFYHGCSAEWTAQQIVDAFARESAPRFMLRDEDGVYGPYCSRRVAGLGVDEVRDGARARHGKIRTSKG